MTDVWARLQRVLTNHPTPEEAGIYDAAFDRAEKLERVAEAARKYVNDETMNTGCGGITRALKELDSPSEQKGNG